MRGSRTFDKVNGPLAVLMIPLVECPGEGKGAPV